MVEAKELKDLVESGDREQIKLVLDKIEQSLHADGLINNRFKLREMIETRKRLASTQIPIRAILDHISLVL
ncbi:MAG: hypothetical protein AAB590_00325 [Patescibacteria group bacterium]